MPLKRGVERGSCDFCFRRKIKCDRKIRAIQGSDTCSQCDTRGERCRMDDSDDIRIQRRRTATMTPRGDNETHCNNQDQPSESLASTPHSGSSVPAAYDHAGPSQYPNEFFFDDAFALSNDSLFFLDQAYMGEGLPTEWSDSISMTKNGNHTRDSATNNIENGQTGVTKLDKLNADFPGVGHSRFTWLDGLADAHIITAAMHAYFDFAAVYLPILLADAFWIDFHAGRCSSSLLYAVACRGMPFTRAANKWELQQQLARKFRETFLEARTAALDDGAVGLDDLEALALMIDFEYDDAGSAPLHANLGRLFLTHESLVLMMLRSQKHTYGTSDAQPSASLARASERRVLLYWHVYGIDAFHSLDRKQQSHIPDTDAISNESISKHEAKDYLDAILALAIIARKITRALCSTAAKRTGVSLKDVRLMYEHLALWRLHGCPQHLRRYRDGAGNLVAGKNNNASTRERHLQLRCAVLWALELNCTMQIEDCVSASRLQVDSCLETEQAALQIECESVRALTEMAEVCKWMRRIEAQSGGTAQHSLVDFAPNALRNICAGLCFWACQRAIDTCERWTPSIAFQAYTRKVGSKEQQVKTYRETAQLLRDSVATAVSHKDTAQVLERLDGQRALLETLLERI
jgi:transcription factor-like protein/Zn(2)-Cys(6) binuclear cluster domain-containing protein